MSVKAPVLDLFFLFSLNSAEIVSDPAKEW